jgi:hypothetical protein
LAYWNVPPGSFGVPLTAEVAVFSLNPSQRPRDIVSYLQKTYPNAIFTQKDVENYRQRLQQDKQNGKTPTQTLIDVLRDTNTYHVVRTDPTEPNKVTGLFWTFAWGIEMWKKYPWVLQLDNTYNTNRFRMPLLQVTGVTNVATTFNGAFGLMDNEREDGFTWLAQHIQQTKNSLSGRLAGFLCVKTIFEVHQFS